jgi:hypothetical protein
MWHSGECNMCLICIDLILLFIAMEIETVTDCRLRQKKREISSRELGERARDLVSHQ